MMKIILILFTLILFISCKKDTVSEKITLPYFNKIQANSYFEIILEQGNENSISITGIKQNIQKIKYEIKDSTLIIENEAHKMWLNGRKNKIQLVIRFIDLQKIELNETCNVHSNEVILGNTLGIIAKGKLNNLQLNLNYNNVYYWNNHPCGGKIELQGQCNFFSIWNYALMQIDAKELKSENVYIENSSKGDCSVYATSAVKYSLKGEGNLNLYGNPPIIIEQEKSSNGKLIKF